MKGKWSFRVIRPGGETLSGSSSFDLYQILKEADKYYQAEPHGAKVEILLDGEVVKSWNILQGRKEPENEN